MNEVLEFIGLFLLVLFFILGAIEIARAVRGPRI